MAIDARVQSVICRENGSGELRLIDRPSRRPGEPEGCKGQPVLTFTEAPYEVTALNGLDLWGGSGSIVLGSVIIAERTGIQSIRFLDDDTFRFAIRENSKKVK